MSLNFGTTNFYHNEKRFGEFHIEFTCGDPYLYPPKNPDADWERRYVRWHNICIQEVYGNWEDITPRPAVGMPMPLDLESHLEFPDEYHGW